MRSGIARRQDKDVQPPRPGDALDRAGRGSAAQQRGPHQQDEATSPQAVSALRDERRAGGAVDPVGERATAYPGSRGSQIVPPGGFYRPPALEEGARSP